MTAFTDLLHRNPLVFFHLVTAIGALAIGAVVMLRRKGNGSHRAWGWSWVVLMACTTVASGFIRDYNMPNVAGITPIHFFTVFVAFQLPRGIWFIRQGNVLAHRKAMRGQPSGSHGVHSKESSPVGTIPNMPSVKTRG